MQGTKKSGDGIFLSGLFQKCLVKVTSYKRLLYSFLVDNKRRGKLAWKVIVVFDDIFSTLYFDFVLWRINLPRAQVLYF